MPQLYDQWKYRITIYLVILTNLTKKQCQPTLHKLLKPTVYLKHKNMNIYIIPTPPPSPPPLNNVEEFDGTSRNFCGHVVIFEMNEGISLYGGTTLNNHKKGALYQKENFRVVIKSPGFYFSEA